ERRVGARAVEGVAADEDAVADAVRARVVEDGARAAEVDLVALLAGDDERRHGGHVDDGVGARLAGDVLGGALADVGLVELDGRIEPRAAVDADDVVPLAGEALAQLAGDGAGGARDEDPHRPYLAPPPPGLDGRASGSCAGSLRRRFAPAASMRAMTS